MKGVKTMKKHNLIVSILYMVWGFGNLLLALYTDTKLDGIFAGMAGAGIVPGLMMLYQYFYWKSPKHAQEYQQRMENERIERRDELKEKVRGWTARYVYSMEIIVTALAMITFTILGSLDVAMDYTAFVLYLGFFLAFQCVAGVVVFNRLMKKYE